MRVDVDRSLQQRLGLAVELQASMEPDLFFLTEEGSKVPAHRSVQFTMVVDRYNILCSRAIVSLHSPFLRSLLSSHPGHLVPVVACPGLGYSDLCALLAMVYTGQVLHSAHNNLLFVAMKYLHTFMIGSVITWRHRGAAGGCHQARVPGSQDQDEPPAGGRPRGHSLSRGRGGGPRH